MKVSHEVPKNLLHVSRFFNDYDYALDIHFDDAEYYNFFKTSVKLGRTVVLDNSLYERRITGAEFNEENYINYIKDINPTYYIVPDAYESSQVNIDLFNKWMFEYGLELISSKKIVVVHGSDYDDYVRCYQHFDKSVKDNDIIAFSGGDIWMDNRPSVLRRMYIDGVINTNRRHHLLGSVYPTEVKEYGKLNFIHSIDTSLPIISTLEGLRLDEITEKPKSVITKVFNDDIQWDLELLYHNLHTFKN